ncbi:toll/interleukin-1 receptor domain-containing protein [Asticcacaulis sp. W401b]|uniref:toll/interleukin-1 receptor domain-containing protein n=1 Tax=Asticcacaulis sp. W401b TaxID=3388666 RepID=UPI0039707A21
MASKLFISYCHKDRAYTDRLCVHLSQLQREEKISVWFDHEITAGSDLSKEIRSELESSDVFIAMISPDYLASRYCMDVELAVALERHKAGKIRLVPVVLEPCEWKMSAIKELKATPRDGQPVSEWQNQNTAFLDVVSEIRRAIDVFGQAITSQSFGDATLAPQLETSARIYRAKKEFDRIDRSDFKFKSFEEIKAHFKSLVSEINGVEGLKARFSDLGSSSFSCTLLNALLRNGTSAITVHCHSGSSGFGDLYYSNTENAPTNTCNGSFSIKSDDYELYWTASFGFSMKEERLTAIEVAESLWKLLLESAGVTYA